VVKHDRTFLKSGWAAGWNFIKLEVKVVKLSLQVVFFLEFQKDARAKGVHAQRLPTEGPFLKRLKWVALPSKI